ncbi:Hypothetical protein GLP15_5165 [Giardia lamblia P15]|uniref:Uncharacterized protein n=1 Tax=Giardia intestinalis (strain P15) TaxID=658858 RepID=E1EW97_GIAIA|nr:Hypothetical protein GLP15_5165 [Giardia lamblia P15]
MLQCFANKMTIVPWHVQLRAELSTKNWSTACIQCNTLGSSCVDTVYNFMATAFPEAVVTIMHPTECCLNVDCALHHKQPVIIAIDVYCPLAYDSASCPVIHVSSKGMIGVSSLLGLVRQPSLHTDHLSEGDVSDRLALPEDAVLLFEKHLLMKARISGIPRRRRLCVNGDNWLLSLVDRDRQQSVKHVAIYVESYGQTPLEHAVAMSYSLLSEGDEEDAEHTPETRMVEDFLDNVRSFALPGYLRLFLSILATASEVSIEKLTLIDVQTSSLSTVEISEICKLVSVTLADNKHLIKSRLKYCINPLSLETVGLIVGDAHSETLASARELKQLLRRKGIAAQLCYFGPKLDEAKLGNFAKQFMTFVFVARCPLLATPWLNSNFRRIAAHYIPCLSLYELRYSLGEPKPFCYEYDSSLQTCIAHIRALCAE